MKTEFIFFLGYLVCSLPLFGQEVTNKQTENMPNRISMNITMASQNKRTINDGKKAVLNVIRIDLTEEGCRVTFPDVILLVNATEKTIKPLPVEKAMPGNSKIQQAGNALSLGAAIPGGSILSAAVSSVSNLSDGTGGGAASAAYAATGKKSSEAGKVSPIADSDNNPALDLPDGNYQLTFILAKQSTSDLKEIQRSEVSIYFAKVSNALKARHDIAMNAIRNVK